MKVILDTDIGDDIDDAFALAICIEAKEIDLLGITTVYRNTHARSQMVSKFLEIKGELPIPVYAGVGTPLVEPIKYFEKDVVDDKGILWPPQHDQSYLKYPVKDGAVDFIIESAKKYPHELTLIPIGPLTNIAQAIKNSPDAMRNVKQIVLMGGWFNEQKPEWNILCDPEAADIVFKSGIPIYAVGLDVTLQCELDQELLEILNRKEDDQSKLLSLWLKRWFDHFNFEKSVLHDPLAVITAIDQKICKFEERFVEVDLTVERGAIRPSNTVTLPIHVAVEVDKDKFFERFIQYIALKSE